MRIPLYLSLFISLAGLSPAQKQSEEGRLHDLWEQAGTTWHERWMNIADRSSSLPKDDMIRLLGSSLGMKVEGLKMSSEKQEVYDRIQKILLDTPGHAEYFANRIKTSRLEYENLNDADPGSTDTGSAQSFLLREQMYGFRAMGHLPSVETVRVLGEFLSDERGRLIYPPDYKGHYPNTALFDRWLQYPNSTYAAMTLQSLPLKNKPHGPTIYIDDHEPPHEWINWYRQIKEGRRTFSFEGDPNEYSLDGPVTVAKNPDVPRPSKRSEPAADGTAGTDAPASRAPWIVAAIVALAAGGGWFFLKKRTL